MIDLPQQDSKRSLMPDMTALLDVIFILLIFMLLTANVSPQLLELDLPTASAPTKNVEENAITVGISEDGTFSLEQKKFDNWQQFQLAVMTRLDSAQQHNKSKPQLLVAADKDTTLQPFVQLANWLAEQGVPVAEVVVSGPNAISH